MVVIVAEEPNDMACQMLFNLSVPWHRLRNLGERVLVPIVFCPVSNEHAAGLLDLSNEVDTFHETIRSSTRLAFGIFPVERSA